MAIVRHWYLLLLLSAAGLCSCDGGRLSVVSSDFGTLSTGEQTTLYTLTNRSGARMTVCDYGARIVSIQVPDRDGVLGDVVVGYGDIASFEKGAERFMGCVIGRYGNRINHASFSIDGQKYELVPNELRDGVPVQCHGGPEGFDRFVWESTPLQEKDRVGVRFQRVSPDGEQGYPGNLNCSVTYWWTEENVCRIEYEATTDRPTVVNLSNHTVFNLKGPGDRYVMNHLMQVESDTYVLANRQLCPDRLLPVEGSPFDFRQMRRVDYRLDNYADEQLRIANGMSGCWIIRDWDGSLRPRSRDPEYRTGLSDLYGSDVRWQSDREMRSDGKVLRNAAGNISCCRFAESARIPVNCAPARGNLLFDNRVAFLCQVA